MRGGLAAAPHRHGARHADGLRVRRSTNASPGRKRCTASAAALISRLPGPRLHGRRLAVSRESSARAERSRRRGHGRAGGGAVSDVEAPGRCGAASEEAPETSGRGAGGVCVLLDEVLEGHESTWYAALAPSPFLRRYPPEKPALTTTLALWGGHGHAAHRPRLGGVGLAALQRGVVGVALQGDDDSGDVVGAALLVGALHEQPGRSLRPALG
mmetsp:Transcript_11630/g.34476  ORF Transcript_11630/g.34476 Transcript_11630/m.34476 type:complete len:213 (+) Transcript_11630:237-875(+)